MRGNPKRIISVVVALGLIVVFVIGAIELATKQDSESSSESSPTTQVGDEGQPVTQSPATNDTEAAQSPAPSSSTAADLPLTGPADFILVSLSLSALLLMGRSYWRSRRELRRWQLNHG